MEAQTARTLEQARKLGDALHTLVVTREWTTPWQSVVAGFSTLQRLELHSGADADPRSVTSWPAALVELELELPNLGSSLEPWIDALPALEVLELRGCGQTTILTEQIGRLEELRELALQNPVADLPDALANLRQLQVLDLAGALNEGAVDAHERPAHVFRPMPPVIARLPALRELIVDECGIFERDIEALAGHETLRVLSLQWGGIADLTCVRALPALRELNLESCYRVRDLRPLAGTELEALSLEGLFIQDVSSILEIPSLRRLNVRGCDELHLAPVLDHPGLETLEADDDVLERWQRRDTRTSVSSSAILEGLESKDPAALEAALRAFVAWTDAHAHAEHNPAYELFGVEHDDSGQTPVPSLTRAVQHPAMPSALLAELVRATFRTMHDSLEPTVHAVQVLVERRDIEAQKAVVDAFIAAGKYYDPGHRMYDHTVHDTFIDDLFPQFQPDALVDLLERLPDDALEGARGGDGMDQLFASALYRATPETTRRVVARLRAYIEEYQEYVGANYVVDLLDQLGPFSPSIGAELGELSTTLEIVVGWKARLEEAARAQDEDAVLAELERVVAATTTGELSLAQLASLGHCVPACLHACGQVPAPLGRSLLRLSFDAELSSWRNPHLLLPLVESDFAETISSVLDEHGEGDERTAQRRRLLTEGLERLANDETTEPTRQQLFEAVALLTGQSSDEVATGLAAKTLARALGSGRREQLEPALDRFLENPSALSIDGNATRMLAVGYEGLYDAEAWDQLGRVADKLRQALPHLSWDIEGQQYALSYPLVAAVQEGGPAFFDAHVAPWLELHGHEIVEPRFAFNLACYHALRGSDEPALISAIRRAIELGKPKEQFVQDSDFAAHLGKPAVRQLLGLPPATA